ncbi:CLUMA_CG016929, isoform A [Clunio marinus]|uniref:CLUMA_CG016929, isoform A n=1 Tax=Clunio marinus TaxID=568069 RepID=A0A1J1IUN1_9DIPT|nr:CLUMA_CG016929, isoform A [Clunio marinus]
MKAAKGWENIHENQGNHTTPAIMCKTSSVTQKAFNSTLLTFAEGTQMNGEGKFSLKDSIRNS